MRILVLNWRDIKHPQAGGAEVYLHEICRRLADKYEITFISSKFPGCRKCETLDGIEIVRVGGRYSVYFLSVVEYLKRRSYDVIIDDINGVPFFTSVYSDVPVIAVVHHLVGWSIFRKELPLPLALLGYVAEKSVPRLYSDCPFVTVSESTRRELVCWGIETDRIHVVPNGVSITPINGAIKNSKPILIYLGRVKRYKRLDHLIRAYYLLNKILDVELVIAGKGDYGELMLLAEQMELPVKFMGEVDDRTKVELLSKAWVYVIPSSKEGWGISVVEANACGTPVVAYDVPGLRDSVRNGYNGFLVRDGDVEALAEAAIKLIVDENLRRKMGKNAVRWARRFSWDRSAKKFERIIRDVS